MSADARAAKRRQEAIDIWPGCGIVADFTSLSISCSYLWLAGYQAIMCRKRDLHFSGNYFRMAWQCPWMKNSRVEQASMKDRLV